MMIQKYLKISGMISLDKELSDEQHTKLMCDITEIINEYGENYMSTRIVEEDEEKE